MYNSHDLAVSIKSVAKEKNIVIKDMLESCELGSNTMSSLYHGKSIAFDSVAKIADYLDVSVDYLLGRTEAPDKYKSSITTGDIQGNNNANMNVNSSKQSNEFDATTIQIAEAFQKLDIFGKAEVMNLITKLSQKVG